MQALGNNIIVRRSETETKVGSIILAASAQKEAKEGVIVAAGPKATSVKKGDRILFGDYAAEPFKIDGEELLRMSEEDVAAVVEEA